MQIELFDSPTPTPEPLPPLDPALGQFMSPHWASAMLVEHSLRDLGDVNVIEPSCGDGAFLGAIPQHLNAIGVDIDPKMAALARHNTGREVIVGDFASVPIDMQDVGLIIGNPNFAMPVVDSFVRRAHSLLVDEGRLDMIIPAHSLSTTSRVLAWNELFSIEPLVIPRSLFPRISLPLVWARFTKTKHRTLVGFLLFEEEAAIMSMPKAIRQALGRPGTWREAVGLALHSLGGSGSLKQVYAALEPRRPTQNTFWRDKCRQTLALYYERIDERHWRLPSIN